MTSNWNFWQTLAFTPVRWSLFLLVFWGVITGISCLFGGLGFLVYLMFLVDPRYDLVWVLVGGAFTLISWMAIPVFADNDYFQNKHTNLIDGVSVLVAVISITIILRFLH